MSPIAEPTKRSAATPSRQGVFVIALLATATYFPVTAGAAPLWSVHADGEPLAITLARFALAANVQVRALTPLQETVTLHIERDDVGQVLDLLLRDYSYIHRSTPQGHQLWVLNAPRRHAVPALPSSLNPAQHNRATQNQAQHRQAIAEDNIAFSTLVQNSIDAEPHVRNEAAVGFGELSGQAGLPWLEQQLNDPDRRVRIAAIESLASIGGVRATELLARALSSPDRKTREHAANNLADLGGQNVMAALRRARNDPDPRLRELIEDLIKELELPEHT